MPGGAQVGVVAQRVGRVARAHQLFGGGRDGGAGEEGAAAGGKGGGAAGAGGWLERCWHGRTLLGEAGIIRHFTAKMNLRRPHRWQSIHLTPRNIALVSPTHQSAVR